MREIKFRAWDKLRKIMRKEQFWILGNMGAYPLQTIPDHEIMQYTGLKDKNGKKIYEGDYIHAHFQSNMGTWPDFDHKCKVIFKEDLAQFLLEDGGGDLFEMGNTHEYEITELEILGNIWENPELLKGDKNA